MSSSFTSTCNRTTMSRYRSMIPYCTSSDLSTAPGEPRAEEEPEHVPRVLRSVAQSRKAVPAGGQRMDSPETVEEAARREPLLAALSRGASQLDRDTDDAPRPFQEPSRAADRVALASLDVDLQKNRPRRRTDEWVRR